jgi:6-phosphogluconolactonase
MRRIAGELGAEAAAERYGELLQEELPAEGGVPILDAALQGLGPDGHTASLFPGNPALQAEGVCTAVHDAPKPPPDRITLTIPVLRAARSVLFFVSGEEKAEAVDRMLGNPDPAVPASLLAGPKTELIADKGALSRLPLTGNA